MHGGKLPRVSRQSPVTLFPSGHWFLVDSLWVPMSMSTFISISVPLGDGEDDHHSSLADEDSRAQHANKYTQADPGVPISGILTLAAAREREREQREQRARVRDRQACAGHRSWVPLPSTF